MKIALDAFGGDNAPKAAVAGAALAVREYGVNIVLTGDETVIKKCAADNGISLDGIEIRHTPEVFSMHDKPTDILKAKRNTSMGLAFDLVANGECDAFLSAGSTGAVVVGGTLIVKRIKGVKRPALGTVVPARDRKFILMDIGANADCRPETVAQFGVMASAYMEKVMGIENPSVGLLNIGTEETKGGELQLASYALLKKMPINFIGNVESRDLPVGVCDAVVTDGFTGNIALKLYEGVAGTLLGMIKKIIYSKLRFKIAGALLKPGLRPLKSKTDYSAVGGAPLLGVKKPVIKAHGSSDAVAIKNAVHQAIVYYNNGVADLIAEGLQKFADNSDKEVKTNETA